MFTFRYFDPNCKHLVTPRCPTESHEQGSTCRKYLTAPRRHMMRTGCCTLEVILSSVCMHAKTGTRSVCKQKKKCGGEEPISSSTADSLVNRQEAPGQYYSDARCEGTAGTHDSADAFLLFCSYRIGVTDKLLFLPSPLSSHLQLLYDTQTKSSPIKIYQMDVLLESSLCAMKNRTR